MSDAAYVLECRARIKCIVHYRGVVAETGSAQGRMGRNEIKEGGCFAAHQVFRSRHLWTGKIAHMRASRVTVDDTQD